MLSRLPVLKKLSPRVRAVIVGGISAVVAFSVIAALQGVIGNLAYLLFLWFGDEILLLIHVNPPLWANIFPSSLLLLAIIAVWLLDRTNLRQDVDSLQDAIDHMNKLDETLVECAPQLLYPKRPDHGLEAEGDHGNANAANERGVGRA